MKSTLVQVFFRTVAALAVGPLAAAAAAVAIANPNYRTVAIGLALALFGALVGGLVAVLQTAASGRSMTATGRALRTLFQGVAQILAGIVYNSVADLVSLPKVIAPLLIGVVLSAGVSYLQNIGSSVPPSPAVAPN
jgi:hypothetical protein